MPPPKPKKKKNAPSKRVKPKSDVPGLDLADEEWIGGSFAMPAFVHEDGLDPYRPEMIVWMNAEEGFVVATTTARSDELLQALLECFVAATLHPMVGPPRLPKRVRVDSPALAEALRARLGAAFPIVTAPLPELVQLQDGITAHLGAQGDAAPPSYLGGDVDAAAMKAFFAAAAALYKAPPWKVIPDDTSLLALTIPDLGVQEAAVCVIGQAGHTRAILFFDSASEFRDYVEAASAVKPGHKPGRMAPLLALNFDERSAVEPELLAEIAQHGWVVAGGAAIPSVAFVDADLVSRAATLDELRKATAAASALSRLAAHKKAIVGAFDGGPPVEVEHEVAGMHVKLRAPHPDFG